jgi:hypothetical protein
LSGHLTRERTLDLSRVTADLKAIRHLEGKLAFCWGDRSRWTNTIIRAGLKWQAKRAGLRVTAIEAGSTNRVT